MRMADIITERLLIRGTRESDGGDCLEIWLDDEMGRYLSDPPRELADEAELNFAVGIEGDEGWYPMVALHRETGDFIGTCSVVPSDGGARWDIGYAVHKRHWRRGYATEVLRALIAEGAARGVASFSATVAKENAASNALMAKLGFRVISDTGSFRKRLTDIVYPEYKYSLEIK